MIGQQFLRVAHGLDVTPIMLELNRAPHLFGRDPGRQMYAGSPHQAVQAVWVRFAVRQNDLAPHRERRGVLPRSPQPTLITVAL